MDFTKSTELYYCCPVKSLKFLPDNNNCKDFTIYNVKKQEKYLPYKISLRN